MNTWILPQPLRLIEETSMMKLMRSKNRSVDNRTQKAMAASVAAQLSIESDVDVETLEVAWVSLDVIAKT